MTQTHVSKRMKLDIRTNNGNSPFPMNGKPIGRNRRENKHKGKCIKGIKSVQFIIAGIAYYIRM